MDQFPFYKLMTIWFWRKKETSNLVPVHREILKSKLWLILRISTSLVLKNYDFDWIRTLGSKPDKYQSENFDKIMKLSRYRANTKHRCSIIRLFKDVHFWGTFSVRLFGCLGLNSSRFFRPCPALVPKPPLSTLFVADCSPRLKVFLSLSWVWHPDFNRKILGDWLFEIRPVL